MRQTFFLIVLLGMSYGIKAQDQFINGNLAIGTSNRTDIGTLHVTSSNTSALPVIRIESATNSDSSFIRFQAKNASASNKYSDISFNPDTETLTFKNPNNASERMTIKSNGNIGIGNSSPQHKLDIISSDFVVSKFSRSGGGGGASMQIDNASGNGSWRLGVGSNNHFGIYKSSETSFGQQLIIQGNGNIGIGTNSPDSKLTVAGKIHAQEVKVTVNAGADFVFNEDYNLPSLESLHKFIKTNKHLPEIASEREMQENGLYLAEMNIKLLQKIEELTLYAINQEKRIKLLEQENNTLKTQEERIDLLEAQINLLLKSKE